MPHVAAHQAAFRLARKNRPAMEWVAAHISVPFKRAASALVDPLPFSGAEAVCLLKRQ